MLHIAYSTLSKTGGHPVNEDFLGVSITPEKSDFILCDGLGGRRTDETCVGEFFFC